MKKIIKVKLGEPVPPSATLIKIEKEKKHNGDDDWYDGGTYTVTEYAYYEVLCE